MTFRQTLGVILGADIGTTLTVQLIAFRVTDYVAAAGGHRLRHHLPRPAAARPRTSARRVLGLGLMFLGLKLILDGVAPLQARTRSRIELLAAVAEHARSSAVLAGAVFSALVTSSAATIGLALALAQPGAHRARRARSPSCSAPTSAPARPRWRRPSAPPPRPSAWRWPTSPSRCSAPRWSSRSSGRSRPLVAATAADPARQIANAHTLLQPRHQPGLPAVHAAGRAGDRGAGARRRRRGDAVPRAATSTSARSTSPRWRSGQAHREALRMADVVQGMLRDVLRRSAPTTWR